MTPADPAGPPQGAPSPGLPTIDVNEYGGKREGERQAMNRRLFMQLLVFDAPAGHAGDALAAHAAGLLREREIAGVVYADALDPHGVALLTWSDDPAHFVRAVRPMFASPSLLTARMRPGWSMLGRTYALGHEPDLEHVLLRRPVEQVTNEAWPWHVWYPLRRTGEFAKLPPAEQGPILREHATIGMAYGQQELAHDIRLACHGLDPGDNEFVIGLVGKDLHPLSHLVQAMRKTKQTSEFIAKMGPFFVGYAAHRSS
jgi:chlorite dismutase